LASQIIIPREDVTPNLAADVYSFGVLLYELIVAHPPFAFLGQKADYSKIYHAMEQGLQPAENLSVELNDVIVTRAKLKTNISELLLELITMCWEPDPDLRKAATWEYIEYTLKTLITAVDYQQSGADR